MIRDDVWRPVRFCPFEVLGSRVGDVADSRVRTSALHQIDRLWIISVILIFHAFPSMLSFRVPNIMLLRDCPPVERFFLGRVAVFAAPRKNQGTRVFDRRLVFSQWANTLARGREKRARGDRKGASPLAEGG